MNRKKNEVDKKIKENIRFWSHCERACKQHGITPEEYADKFYRVSDYPIDTSIVNNILNDLPF